MQAIPWYQENTRMLLIMTMPGYTIIITDITTIILMPADLTGSTETISTHTGEIPFITAGIPHSGLITTTEGSRTTIPSITIITILIHITIHSITEAITVDITEDTTTAACTVILLITTVPGILTLTDTGTPTVLTMDVESAPALFQQDGREELLLQPADCLPLQQDHAGQQTLRQEQLQGQPQEQYPRDALLFSGDRVRQLHLSARKEHSSRSAREPRMLPEPSPEELLLQPCLSTILLTEATPPGTMIPE